MRSSVGTYFENASAGTRTLWSAAVGVIAGVLVGFFSSAQAAALIGWDVAVISFMTVLWPLIGRMDAEETERRATRLDPSKRLADLLVIAAGLAILTAVALALVRAGRVHGAAKAFLLAVGIASVALSWLAVQSVFTLRYAQLYYGGQPGGIDFNEPDDPNYVDFAYLAFTIGMTFQVSDTNLKAKPIRRTALQQAFLSYIFGTVILALVINIVATLL